jgi:hypothetical protein
MRTRWILLAAIAAAIPATGIVATTAEQQAPAIDRRVVIDAVRKAIRENYVLPAKRAPLEAALEKGLASGRYAVADPRELAQRVNADLFAVSNDKHLGLNFDPEASKQLGARPQGDVVQDGAFFESLARRRNHGVSELKLLDGNIRYLKYDGFMWTGPESQAAIDGAIAFLRGGDAIVIDLRGNGGGSPAAVKRLASYFVPAGAKLVTFHMRSDPPDVSTAEKEVPGGRIAGVPVYVLTSGRTASAAEEFASHVAGFEFATLVGETTAGAAYRNEHFPIPQGFVLSVSVGRPELPDGSDWEAKGVAPAIAVASDLALFRAQEDALGKLAAKAEGPLRTQFEWAAAALRARTAPAALVRPIAAYAGRFGPRAISVEDGRLFYRRDGGIATALLPLGPDLFVMEADAATRVRFSARGDSVTGFELLGADGSVRPQAREPAS